MKEFDEIIRESLHAQVLESPPLTAPADRAIGAARRIRRRRHAITFVCIGVIVLALAGGAVAVRRDSSLGHPPVAAATPGPTEAHSPDPTPTATTSTYPTGATTTRRPDLLIDQLPDSTGWRTLLTSTGRRIPLTGLDGAAFVADRVVGGWLVPTAASLWLLTPDGSAHKLTQPVDGYALAPDRTHLAWRAGNRLYVGHLIGTTLRTEQSTAAPARGYPIAYTGSAVVLGYTETGGGIDNHDVWIPARGDYAPSWNKTPSVVAVYQPAPDGTLYGVANTLTGGKRSCLAVFDPLNNLQVNRTACGPAVTVDPTGLVSPDGTWLAAWSYIGYDPGTILIRLHDVFTNPAVSQSWPAGNPVAWLDSTTLVIQPPNGPLSLARVGDSTLTPITGLPTGDVGVVR